MDEDNVASTASSELRRRRAPAYVPPVVAAAAAAAAASRSNEEYATSAHYDDTAVEETEERGASVPLLSLATITNDRSDNDGGVSEGDCSGRSELFSPHNTRLCVELCGDGGGGGDPEAASPRWRRQWRPPSEDTFGPRFAYCREYRARRASFDERWPHDADNEYVRAKNIHSLATAGFFFSGVQDTVICFYCALALSDWAAVMAKGRGPTSVVLASGALREHSFWNVNCRFVVAAGGWWSFRTYAPSTRLAVQRSNLCTSPIVRGGQCADRYVDLVTNLRRDANDLHWLLEMVHGTCSAVSSLVHKTSCLRDKARAWMETAKYCRRDDIDGAQGLADRLQDLLHDEVDAANDDFMRERRRVEDAVWNADCSGGGDDISMDCVVCFERTRNCFVLPCRHMYTCTTCAAKLKTCPVCRRTIWFAMSIIL